MASAGARALRCSKRVLSPKQINSIHRLHFAEQWSIRKIARHLHLARRTISQYRAAGTHGGSAAARQQTGPVKATIAELLEQDAEASAVVIRQRLRPLGLQWWDQHPERVLTLGARQRTVEARLCAYGAQSGRALRNRLGPFRCSFLPGHARKLYAFCLVECHSRKLYVEFTHSQSKPSCAATFTPFTIWVASRANFGMTIWRRPSPSTMATWCVPSHDFSPLRASTVSCHEPVTCERRGKKERSKDPSLICGRAFWPLRSFTDLTDVNLQVRKWLEEVADQRRHRETNQTPQEGFQPEALRALPALTPDYRDVAEALVHKDLRLSFDGNRYCVPPRYLGRDLTIKADSSSVTIYDQQIVSYARCWQRGQVIGGERFKKNCSRNSRRRSARRHNSA